MDLSSFGQISKRLFFFQSQISALIFASKAASAYCSFLSNQGGKKKIKKKNTKSMGCGTANMNEMCAGEDVLRASTTAANQCAQMTGEGRESEQKNVTKHHDP